MSMKKFLSLAAALFIAFAANATIRPITPTHCFEGDRADGYTLYVEIARGAQAGDTIELADGEYIEPLTMTIDKNIVVMAAENAHPVLKMSGYFDLYASAVFIGIKFDHTDVISNSYGFYVRENTSKSLTLEGCEFTGFDKYCVTGSQSSGHCDAVIANNCYFHDCNNGPFYFPNSSLADGVNMCNHLEVTNSTFANINVQGWVSAIDLRNNGNSTAATSKLIVDHCTFYNCQGDYERLIQSYKSPDAHITNCIMMNPVIEGKTEIYATYLYGGEIHHNLNYQTKRQYGSGVTVTDSICRDPQFVDAANGDYHLAATSPAIGAGTNGSNLGDPRWWPAAAPAHTYTVAGGSAVAFGTTWDASNDANDMTLQSDNTYKWEKTNLTLPAGIIEFKVCEDHAWTNSWPSSNYVINIAEAGIYTIAIYYNPNDNNYVGAVVTKTGSAEVDPTVSVKGGWDSWANEVVFVLADNKLTATGTLNIAVAGDYEFKVILNGSDWRANGYTYHRGFTGAEGITGNGDNMLLQADLAGQYLITWTFATNAINFTFPVADGIDNTEVKATVVKTIENGQLIIIKNGVRYNAQGAELR